MDVQWCLERIEMPVLFLHFRDLRFLCVCANWPHNWVDGGYFYRQFLAFEALKTKLTWWLLIAFGSLLMAFLNCKKELELYHFCCCCRCSSFNLNQNMPFVMTLMWQDLKDLLPFRIILHATINSPYTQVLLQGSTAELFTNCWDPQGWNGAFAFRMIWSDLLNWWHVVLPGDIISVLRHRCGMTWCAWWHHCGMTCSAWWHRFYDMIWLKTSLWYDMIGLWLDMMRLITSQWYDTFWQHQMMSLSDIICMEVAVLDNSFASFYTLRNDRLLFS